MVTISEPPETTYLEPRLSQWETKISQSITDKTQLQCDQHEILLPDLMISGKGKTALRSSEFFLPSPFTGFPIHLSHWPRTNSWNHIITNGICFRKAWTVLDLFMFWRNIWICYPNLKIKSINIKKSRFLASSEKARRGITERA